MLANATVLDRDASVRREQCIAISGGIITSVGPGTAAGEIIDCSGCVVTPGLVNLHTHAAMVIFRGVAEDVPIQRWFNDCIWPYESMLTPGDVRTGARLACAEMIENGVTAFFDHYFHAGSVADAVVEAGLRADIAPTVFGLGPGVDAQIDSATRLIETRMGQAGRVFFRMGPHAPYTCPPPVLKAIVRRAQELGVGIHIHLSETLEQVRESVARTGKTPFEVLAAAGGFDLPVLAGHGLWVEEADLALINEDTWFAFCPKTYMKLSMGPGRLWNLVERLQVGIGTDGAASSGTLSPLEQVRLLGLAGKLLCGDAQRFGLGELWRILMNGHRVLNLDSGRVEAGMAADLVVWDLAQCNTAPVTDPLAALIYSADRGNVRHVLVDGRFLKRDGRLTTLDRDQATAGVQTITDRLLAARPGTARVRY